MLRSESEGDLGVFGACEEAEDHQPQIREGRIGFMVKLWIHSFNKTGWALTVHQEFADKRNTIHSLVEEIGLWIKKNQKIMLQALPGNSARETVVNRPAC